MKKLRNILIILSIMIVVLIVIIIILNKKKDSLHELRDDGVGLDEPYIIDTAYPVNNANVFYTVEYCVQKYLNYVSADLNQNYYRETYNLEKSEDKYNKIINILNSRFIEKNNINRDNISNFIELTNIPISFTALQIKTLEIDNIRMYGVYGRLEEKDEKKIIGYKYYTVYLDIKNMTFGIEPINNIDSMDNIILEKNIDVINKNEDNLFSYKKIPEEELIYKYQLYLKDAILRYPEEIYNMLNKNYKENKFNNLEEFKTYTVNNKKRFEDMTFEKYLKNNENGITQFVCADKKGRYYIINQDSIMNFTLILDTYTIDIPEFVQKYNEVDIQGKTALNIQKVVDALNDQDYKYVYNKLANSFKQNYFRTLNDFEEYAKKEFGTENTVEYIKFIKTNNYTTYTIKLKNVEREMTKKIIMDLQDGTDFVFSFNVD